MATILGGDQDDLIVGDAGNDRLAGLDGDDTLVGGGGDDTLEGGPGEDRAVVDRGADTADLVVYILAPGFETRIGGALLTGIEHVTLSAGSGADRLVGGAGDDSLDAGAGADALAGGAGADTLRGGEGADTLMGGAGADLLDGGPGADRFALQDAAAATADSTLLAMDTIRGFDRAAGDLLWLRGQSAAGAILPLDGPGRFGVFGEAPLPVGFAGSLAPQAAPLPGLALPDPTAGAAFQLFWLPDSADPAAAGWLLLDRDRDGGLGTADLVTRIELAMAGAPLGADDFVSGSFAVLGSTGADARTGTVAADTIWGFTGNDTLAGGAGSDSLVGGEGADSLDGEAGFDTLRGGAGADSLAGGEDADVLDGGADADSLGGGWGADLLLGGAGADLLLGEEGDDTLEGAGRGETGPLAAPDGGDTLTGGAGADLFVLQGGGDSAWSTLGAISQVTDFDRAQGDRIRIGAADGTLTGGDGVARPLVFSGGPGTGLQALQAGLRLPAQSLPGLDAIQVFWVRAVTAGGAAAGGWLVLDLDRDGRLGAADSVTRFGSAAAPVTIGPEDLLAGSLLGFAVSAAPAGSAGDDTLRGTGRAEGFLGTAGADSIDGGAGAPNAVSYAALGGTIAFTAEAGAPGRGRVEKSAGGTDLLRAIHAVTGTAGDDTLDGGAAPSDSLFVLSLDGGAGRDRILGNGARTVQASYATSPAAVRIDLGAGTAEDGWGSTDTLSGIRRIAATSAFDDTIIGSAADEVFLSGSLGAKRFEGGGGLDEYRYVGAGAVTIVLTDEIVGVFRVPARAEKPGGARDLLLGIGAAVGGAGDDLLRGGAGADRLAGGPGADTLDGGGGLDTVAYDVVSASAGLPLRGVVLDLTAGTATDPWGAADTLISIENAWGTQLADDMTGRAVAGQPTFLRGLAGDDTLRAPSGGNLVAADFATDPAGITADLAGGWALDGWGGRDLLIGITALRGSAFADTVVGSAQADRIEGGEGDDSLRGAGGADRLLGGEGRDTLDGGAGADTLEGGPGGDLYIVDNAADSILEAIPEAGVDRAIASIGYYLPDGVEELELAAGAGGIFGVGNGLPNRILGNEGANLLIAHGGADTVEGGAGNDSLFGLSDPDLLLAGDANDWALGGDANDTIEGGDGNDALFGEAGDDLIRGQAGADYMVGGAGADTLEGGDGNDQLYGQDDGDLLLGGAGIDFLAAGPGDDTLDGGDQPDSAYGEAGNDLIYGGTGFFTDILVGGDGNDTLDGSARPGTGPRNLGDYDRMTGGNGDDVYWVDTPFDLTFEGPNGGRDTVHADIRGTGYYLYAHTEDLVLHGATTFGVGNDLANRITGTPLSNWLLGGAGNDTLDGQGGSDVLFGQGGADLLILRRGAGRTTVGDFQPGIDRLQLEGYGFADAAAVLATRRQVGAHTVLDLARDETVILQYVSASALGAQDVILL